MRRLQFSIKARLIFMLGTSSALLLAVGLMGVHGQQQSNRLLGDMYTNKLVPTTALTRILEGYASDRAEVTRAAASQSAQRLQQARQQVRQTRTLVDRQWHHVEASKMDHHEKVLMKRISADRTDFGKDADAAIAAMQTHDYAAAEKLFDHRGDQDYGTLRRDVLGLLDAKVSASRTAFSADRLRARRSAIASLAAIGGGLILSLLVGILLIRRLTRSLRKAVGVADRIAGGQLANRIEVRSEDEVGRLLLALKKMDTQLTRICSGVRDGSEAVSVAAGQIAHGTDDLSRRTQEQASSLEETAASMEEMTSTVRLNADSARQADQMAGAACRQAEEGGAVVREAVAAMEAIGESSQRIGDIVGLIDEIAFQTNLLSLNAAVEAARAGEQGRGFAVVASEVRALAQRSAEAAREIKALIEDAGQRVEAGQVLVGRSGDTLSGIVASVKKVTDIVAEIAAASSEQSTSIEQVNSAVMTMDEVTQHNSALVEESAAASRAMQEQAEALMQQVAYFRFDGVAEPASPPRGDEDLARDVVPAGREDSDSSAPVAEPVAA